MARLGIIGFGYLLASRFVQPIVFFVYVCFGHGAVCLLTKLGSILVYAACYPSKDKTRTLEVK